MYPVMVSGSAPNQRDELLFPKWCFCLDLGTFVSPPLRHPPPPRNEPGAAEPASRHAAWGAS
jgi:hypothetical protein